MNNRAGCSYQKMEKNYSNQTTTLENRHKNNEPNLNLQ